MMLRILGGAVVLLALVTPVHAETFDLTTYTPPAGWTAETTKSAATFTQVDRRAGTFCRIQLLTSTRASRDPRADFLAEWRLNVKAVFKAAGDPVIAAPRTSSDGWDVHVGGAQTTYDGKPTQIVQVVAFKGGVRVPLLYTATADCSAQLEAFTDSITFGAAGNPSTPLASTTPALTDAWVATPKADWVEVASKAGKVLVHYPNAKADAYDSVLANSVRTAWSTLVAPHYTNVRNLVVKPIQSYQSITFAEADATEKGTNRNVHVVLFKLHDSQATQRYLEFVTDTKASFERAWGPYHNDELGWDKLAAMGTYDRFTLTPAALAGTWTSTDFASIGYYYVSSGRLAGADATSIANQFTFDAKSGYTSDHSGASGAVGQAKFSRQQYRGAYAIDQGTRLTLTKRFRGASETYTGYFRAVKGGNALVLIDAQNTVTYLGKKK